MGLGLLTVLVVPSGRAEPLRTPAEEEEEDRCDEEQEDEHRHALEGGEGDAPIRIFLRIFHPHRVHHRAFLDKLEICIECVDLVYTDPAGTLGVHIQLGLFRV